MREGPRSAQAGDRTHDEGSCPRLVPHTPPSLSPRVRSLRRERAVSCACCGQEREPLVALRSRSDVQLCRDCISWLAGKVGVDSTPILPVADANEAVAFYERAGFSARV